MYPIRQILTILLCSAGYSTNAIAQDVKPLATESESAAAASVVSQWREDVNFLAREIRTHHPAPFAMIDESDFDVRVDALLARAAQTPPADMVMEMSDGKIISSRMQRKEQPEEPVPVGGLRLRRGFFDTLRKGLDELGR